MSDERDVSADRRRMLLLLAPHATAILAFLAAFGVMLALDTNRSLWDLRLAIGGSIAAVIGLGTSLVGVLLFPWTKATGGDWGMLALHAAAIGVIALLGNLWIGAHLA